MIIQKKLVIGKVKDEIGRIVFEEFVGLRPKMYAFIVDNCKYKKEKGVNKNIISTITHKEYKDVLLNNKCIKHPMNRIQSKNHRIGTYEINKIFFDDKIYVQNNGYDELAIGYHS